MARIRSVDGRTEVALDSGWELTTAAANDAAAPAHLGNARDWIAASVPGTAAQALAAAGLWSFDKPTPLHDRDVWWRGRFEGEGAQTLRFDGLATLAEVWLNGEPILSSDSMFRAHCVEATLRGVNEMHIAFRALHPALAAKKGPRARWRPRLAQPASLRLARTTLLGHMDGWCPPVHAVGPYRPIVRVAESGPLRVGAADMRATLEGRDGVLTLTLDARWIGSSARPDAFVEVAGVRAPLAWSPDSGSLAGVARIPDVARWMPHTHGAPTLHGVRAQVGDVAVDLGRVGFRSIEVDRGADGRGFALRVNGERVFCRGVCWSAPDLVTFASDRAAVEPDLRRIAAAGLNMVRVPGVTVYPSDDFFSVCDELGLLVWQDFMFANFDYPANDEGFRASVTIEAAQLLDRAQASPSLAVLCGGSEVSQQAAMLGLPPALWSNALFDEVLPAAAAKARPDVAYVANSPVGGALPFVADEGVAHYYGVGAYMRPLEDARRANVRFASECLAFSHVPEPQAVERVCSPAEAAGRHPAWLARVPRDAGAAWNFEDVREHYLRDLYEVDPTTLRMTDPDRWLDLSRAVTGEVVEATLGEWRRGASGCAGSLLWLHRDLAAGAGWGLLDASGAPKAVWHALRRASRPVQLTMTDEGVNGLGLHLINETGATVAATLSLTCLRDGATPVVRARRETTLPPRSTQTLSSAEVIGSFFDVTYAYRFGPASHDVVVATLADAATGETIAEAFHFPTGRSLPLADLGLRAELVEAHAGWSLKLSAQRFALSVHVEDAHWRAEDDWFHLAPGGVKSVALSKRDAAGVRPAGVVRALNGLVSAKFGGTA